ncbi:ABC transporter substrate-binding protein [Microbacterium sp. A84]|uniref:ABC transporter substrate-binding protein n=1 Tax=Microbacterium sp. A84 TaxID=3450715 RepID=UPI003F42682C
MKKQSTTLVRVLGAVAAIAMISATAACSGTDPDDESTDGTKTLKAGYVASLGAAAQPFMAERLGCYDGLGIEVELTPVANPADAIAFLANEKLDIYIGSPTAGMFNQVAQGSLIKAVSGQATINTPGDAPAPSGFFAAKKLVDSGEVKTVADLKGMRVGAIGAMGTASSYLIGKSLEQGGLTPRDVELIPLSLADTVTALENGGIDAAFLAAPYSSMAVDQGVAVPIVDSKEAYGDETTATIIFGPTLLEKDRESGAAFLKAMECATEPLQGDYRKNPDVVAALSEGLKVPEDTITDGALYYFDPALTLNESTFDGMQKMFADYGGLLTYKDPLPIDKLVDREILADALK